MAITVSGLNIYPIKSLRGISLERSPVEKRGLRYDRRWMLVDSQGIFLTQRKIARMALFDTEITADGLRVQVHGMPPVDVPFEPQGGTRKVEVWGSIVTARRVSDDADRWFSEALGIPCSLVHMPDTTVREASSETALPGDIIGFADSNPVLVAGEASLADLNGRLDATVPMRRFRPNVVVSGSGAWEEDSWAGMQVGGVRLRPMKRCGRCIVTTIDPETAVSGEEPLRTLAGYRLFGKAACFGMFYSPDTLGQIAVGDRVQVGA